MNHTSSISFIHSCILPCLAILALLCACRQTHITPDGQSDKPLTIFPDYTGVTFPCNIAPPNFRIMEEETTGETFYIRIFVRQNGKWIQFPDITNYISESPIDPYLVYRLIYPGYELWNQMGIYQRDLTSYREIPLIENQSIEKDCLNCHTFCKNSPETMMIHIRGKVGGTLVYRQGKINRLDVKSPEMKNGGAYAAWHPEGRYLAFSVNEIQQYFHSTGPKAVEVSDSESDLLLLEKNGWKLSLPGVQTEQCSTSAGAKQSMKKRLWTAYTMTYSK